MAFFRDFPRFPTEADELLLGPSVFLSLIDACVCEFMTGIPAVQKECRGGKNVGGEDDGMWACEGVEKIIKTNKMKTRGTVPRCGRNCLAFLAIDLNSLN